MIAINRAIQEISDAEDTSIRYVILTDSKSSLQSLQSYKPTEYYHLCHDIIRRIKEISNNICLQWIPSHIGILGNEEADRLAKEATSLHPVNKNTPSLPTLKNSINHKINSKWINQWRKSDKGREYFKIQPGRHKYRYRGIDRKEQVQLSRLKMHHYPCQSYLHRFRLADSPTCLLCDEEEETVSHILLKCPQLRNDRMFETTQDLASIFENRNNEWKCITDIIKTRGEGPWMSEARFYNSNSNSNLSEF